MSLSEQSIIGELVATDYRYATVFQNNKIDFCCQGNRTIEEACDRKKVSIDALLVELNNAAQVTDGASTDFNSWPLDLLATYIEKKHHRYVESRITEIKPMLAKIVKVHGDMHPELLEVEELFLGSAGELTAHMKKEEFILFPFVKKLVEAQESNTEVTPGQFGTVANPIAMMMDEHSAEGERFRKIAEITNDYTPPKGACTTYMVTFSLLKEFEQDLHHHIHLENNILFPKAIELEKTLVYA
ncbi:regulator of cell morphogenesis and NO signaling [Algoriphagus ratkowskyi]|uniref:Iron-sulfur cluster repair di-iron protein n=1 Tax=Algoriphagus ratkowskyi TaxID=57028 RepID=A0A2W7RIW8_9BACT|nr:iron-sulfur cluster repair di-iron protein [Algoriphagus ratkowskyi]PZX50675.1 regulator of cell morphogenesis and NO signaling [Algoriphagus ratkowskyi]TXD80029.1 iron-sulfur cluster repair di-iron protein [Algoriphagus ratkowskyi]